MSDRVRLGVVGAGLIGRRHVERIGQVTEAELVGIADPSDAAGRFATEVGAPHFPTLAAMIASAHPDGVIVATPNVLHVENGLEAIEAGIPALVEKPIADDIAGARLLADGSERANVPILVGHHRRHNPLVRAARDAIVGGKLGRIVAAHGMFWLMKPDEYFDVAWRRSAGGGPALLNMIHDVDLLRFLCGEIEEVFAYSSNAVRGNPVEETCAVAMRFAGGALGTFALSDTAVAPWSWEMTARENPVYPYTEQSCYQIAGTLGALSVPRLDIWSYDAKRSWWEPLRTQRLVAAVEDPLRRQIQHFCRVVRREEAPVIDARDGMATLRVVLAALESARAGKPVRPDAT